MSASNLSDPALVRGLTQRRIGRRDALRLSGLSVLGTALAACGVQGKGKGKPTASAAPDAVAKYWTGKTKNGHVDFACWPLYMDPKHPELKKFTAETGVTVNYQEVIQEMAPWFAKVQPQLSAGQSIGYDLMVITNGVQFTQFVDSGFLAPLDHAKLPNYAANAAAKYKSETYRPEQRLQRSVGVRHHRHRVRPGQGEDADHEARRSVGPRAQGQGRDVPGHSGAGQLRAAWRSASTRRSRPPTTGSGPPTT